MDFKEIVCCFVSETIAMPDEFSKLRESFTKNGFSEKQINPNKWLFKKGAAFSPELNYNSEVLEMQVILEKTEDNLRISVGNWGFPFEPLMMKKRFKKYLSEIVGQISKSGELVHNPPRKKEGITIKKHVKPLIGAVITFIFLWAGIGYINRLLIPEYEFLSGLLIVLGSVLGAMNMYNYHYRKAVALSIAEENKGS